MDAAKVRTRAEALDMSKDRPGKLKRRKVGNGEELAMSSSLTHELKNNLCKNSPASDSPGDAIAADNESLYPNFGSHGGASCCSSNGSDTATFDKFDSADMERGGTEASSSTKYNSSERGEETTLKLKARETLLQRESTSKTRFQRQVTTEKFMPSEAQLEEFFAVAERDLRNQFADKYNYDISKDEPVFGRYEWVLLKP